MDFRLPQQYITSYIRAYVYIYMLPLVNHSHFLKGRFALRLMWLNECLKLFFSPQSVLLHLQASEDEEKLMYCGLIWKCIQWKCGDMIMILVIVIKTYDWCGFFRPSSVRSYLWEDRELLWVSVRELMIHYWIFTQSSLHSWQKMYVFIKYPARQRDRTAQRHMPLYLCYGT